MLKEIYIRDRGKEIFRQRGQYIFKDYVKMEVNFGVLKDKGGKRVNLRRVEVRFDRILRF